MSLGEINGFGILSTLKSEKSFPFWKTFCISKEEQRRVSHNF